LEQRSGCATTLRAESVKCQSPAITLERTRSVITEIAAAARPLSAATSGLGDAIACSSPNHQHARGQRHPAQSSVTNGARVTGALGSAPTTLVGYGFACNAIASTPPAG
jgi:hypothetical protein